MDKFNYKIGCNLRLYNIVSDLTGWTFSFGFFFFFFYFFKEFQPIASAPDYYQTKTPNDFCCKQWLNLRSFIQQLKTLLIQLIETHFLVLDSCLLS